MYLKTRIYFVSFPGKHILASIGLLMLLTANGASAAYDVGLYCQLVVTGTKLPSFDSCQDYFVCQTDGYTEESCPATESFDKNAQSCKPASAVKCNYGAENPCANVADGFVQNPENCYAWIGCKNEVETNRGTCPDQQYYDVTLGRCEWGTCTNNQGDDIVQIENLCEIMANGAFFGDSKDCKTYHKCVDGKMVSGSCNGNYVSK